PPTTSTLPSCRRVAVRLERGILIFGPSVHVSVAGSKSSGLPELPLPRTNTLPSDNKVTVGWYSPCLRGVRVTVHVCVPGSYISALVTAAAPPPPTTRTLPSANSVAACSLRAKWSG